ncbi:MULTISPECIES: PAS domain-containing protein [Raoultella]|uniref:helix-turn-helix transcriptional regulator n=1 Tax=Raoultella TaxID=160674 RepID=UPI00286E1A55|nr:MULTISPECIES: PAS domain-containing protein [Raoultella]MCS4273132.1 putative transcriptional regulator YheO [Raoultella sp. BIGb0132]MCS4289496.1 putative transcriptional regulator YheO [Raoultella terrigena]
MPSQFSNPSPAHNYQAIADSIAALLFPHAEVVLHCLKTQSVVYIANNFSGRSAGDDAGLEMLSGNEGDETTIGPYEKTNWNGQKIRSISTVLRDGKGRAEMMMCINLNLSVLEQARDVLNLFFQAGRVIPQPDALFRDDWQERINVFIQSWLREQQLSLATLSRGQKRLLVSALYDEGAFEGKSAANYVSRVLQLGRATVYKYLKEFKEERA